ncbi:MAG: hypothetical protein IJJ06_02370 [Mogibacterium sp.]|nr:hypothetical protein [Mogibacterium sp.]
MSRAERNARKESQKKRRRRLIRAGNCVVVLACMILVFAYISKLSIITPEPEYVFAGGTSKNVPVYLIGIPVMDEETSDETSEQVQRDSAAEAVKVGKLVRGSSVKKLIGNKKIDGVNYCRVDNTGIEGAGDLYMKEENLVPTSDRVVQETEVYVRTPVTIYSKEKGPSIASFASKGTCLKVTGYDMLLEDGSVHKYKVEYPDGDDTAEGFVYSKYMAATRKKAEKVYNKNGVYDKVKDDKYGYELYGGKAKNLDYYPYERISIEGNEFCSNARAMYLNCAAAADPDSYVKLIRKTDCNAVVVDIKDGVLAWPARTAKEWSPKSYKTAYTSRKKYKSGIDKLKETGVYMIGRIVVFNDPVYAKDHPEDCIKYAGKSTWPSAYSRDVWEYNVRLAQEAIKEFGFNEIQFDYVRFPENAYDMSKNSKTKFRNYYGEEKGQAIQNFCFYAADQIHESGAYFSVDVFGESAYGYMTAYGQYWPGIANVADAISAMPYTDHMGVEGLWRNPYSAMKSWGKKAKKMQNYLEHPAAARTWITGYNTPYWAPTEDYGEKELKAQIKGLKEAGLKGGFIPWNVISDLGKYKQYKNIWNKN